LRGEWIEPDKRDEVVEYVQRWSAKTEMGKVKMIDRIGISRSKYYEWEKGSPENMPAPRVIPRDFWLEEWEKKAIIDYSLAHPLEGYRRLAYRMMDEEVVAASPSTVYRVLSGGGFLRQWSIPLSSKGKGFEQPGKPHEHWHVDVAYVNIRGTFYYLFSILDGYSRLIVHWEIRESMRETEVEIILQRARERYPQTTPRIISDNGPQFVAREFKEYIRISGMTHVRTSPYYPQSNGKVERWHRTIKGDCIRRRTPLSLEDARRIVEEFVREYNTKRLHGAIGYVTPLDKAQGREREIWDARDGKLAAARERRRLAWRKKNFSPAALTGNAAAAENSTVGNDVRREPSQAECPSGHEDCRRTAVGVCGLS
jgi:transposase InsO family protein